MAPAIVLVLAVLGISVAAPLIRLSEAHPLAIAIWRLGFSLVIVAAFLLGTGSWRRWSTLSRRDLVIAAAAGVFLALHFWSWNTSVGLTTVAASVVLVNLQAPIVAIAGAAWLREAPNRTQWLGIALALAGAVIVAAPDLGGAFSGSRRALLGDALALLGAATAAGYYLAGRRLRQSMDLWPYVGLVYATCLITLLIIAAFVRAPVLSQPPRELAIFAALAIGPMMLGHTGMNWALRYLPAYVVSLAVLGEPVGATILAALLPGIREIPGMTTLLGGAIILAGIVLTARATESRSPSPPGTEGSPASPG